MVTVCCVRARVGALRAHKHAASAAESGRAELGALTRAPHCTFTAELPVTKHFISENLVRVHAPYSKQ